MCWSYPDDTLMMKVGYQHQHVQASGNQQHLCISNITSPTATSLARTADGSPRVLAVLLWVLERRRSFFAHKCCTLGWRQMVQVWPSVMGQLPKWSTIYMMTPGNWVRPETWLEIVLLIFFRPHVKYKAFSLRKKYLAITFERRVLRTWG